MIRYLTRICTLLSFLTAASTAHAIPVTYGSYTVLNSQAVTLNDPILHIHNEVGGAGQVTLQNLSIGGVLNTWCVDIQHSLLSSGAFGSIAVFTGAVWDGINALISHADALVNSDPNASAALQVAIWAQEYGTGLSISAPWAVAYEAQLFLANVSNGTWKADPNSTVAVLQGNGITQSQAYLVAAPQTSALVGVPEPVSAALLGTGLLAMGLYQHRRRRAGLA